MFCSAPSAIGPARPITGPPSRAAPTPSTGCPASLDPLVPRPRHARDRKVGAAPLHAELVTRSSPHELALTRSFLQRPPSLSVIT